MSEIVDVPAAYDNGYKEGFQDGLRHAIRVVEQAKPYHKDLSRGQWIAVVLTLEEVAKKIGNGTALYRERNSGCVEAACSYCEIDRLKEEVKERDELIQMLAEAYKNMVEIIVHKNREVQGE